MHRTHAALPRERAAAIARVVQYVSLGAPLVRDWRPVRLLAVGARSVVFEAVGPSGERVAIKAFVADGATGNGFQRELVMTELARGGGAPRVVDVAASADGVPVMVLELFSGRTLLEHWSARRYRFDPLTAVTFTDKILAVLEALHGAGIVHGDVQPRHVFVTDRGEVRLIDFARAARLRDTVLSFDSVWSEEPAPDRRKDLVAVAATLYALITGVTRRADAGSASIGPPGLRDVLEFAMHESPTAGFANAQAMRAALRGVFADYLGVPIAFETP